MHARTALRAGLAATAAAALLGWPAWAAVAWVRFGRAPQEAGRDPLLDGALPTYEVAETHETRVAAPAAFTYAAVERVGLERSPAVRAIVRARERILRVDGGDGWPPGGVPAQLRAWGWGVLAEVPGREIVLGAVTQPWEGDVRFRALPPAEFAAFDSAGFVKIVVAFSTDPLGPYESVFRTRTRVAATDSSARSRFRRYWSVFSPGILLIRHAALRAVRHDAERHWRADSVRPADVSSPAARARVGGDATSR